MSDFETTDSSIKRDSLDAINTTTTTTTSKQRRCSILKLCELDEPEESTKIRKSRRVSFSAKIQVKTIEEDLVNLKENDLITIANTNANSTTSISKKVLNETTNRVQTLNVSLNQNNSKTSPLKNRQMNDDFSNQPMDLVNSSQISIIDYSNIFENTENSMIIDSSMQVNKIEETINASKIAFDDITMIQSKNLNEVSIDDESSSIKDQCFKICSKLEVSKMNFNDVTVFQTMNESETTVVEEPHVNETENQTIQIDQKTFDVSMPITSVKNETFTVKKDSEISSIDNLESSLSKEHSAMNQTQVLSKNETFTVSNKNKDDLFEEKKLESTPLSLQAVLPETNLPNTFQPISINNETANNQNNTNSSSLSFSLQNQLFKKKFNFDLSNMSILDLTQSQSANESENEIMSEMEKLKQRLEEAIEKTNCYSNYYEEKNQQLTEETAEMENKLSVNSILNKDLRIKLNQIKEKTLKLEQNNSVESRYFMNYFNADDQARCDKIEAELKHLKKQNESNEKEYKSGMEAFEAITEKFKINSEKIEAMQSSRSEKDSFKNLCEKIFNQNNIGFKLINLEKDTILVSFFFDFIQLEIKATNIISDLSGKHHQNLTLNSENDLNDLFEKCLNYPIQKLYTRSTIDSIGNSSIDSPFHMNDKDRKNLKKKNSKQVPVYIRYCVDLILNDIGEGDLLKLTKKYKYIKDLPMLIAHFNLACKCATNLVRDFEHFADKCTNTPIKCDFDFKNHIVSIVLPSLEDGCYYRLKLGVKPGKYYQEALSFTIEPEDKDDLLQPNIQKLSKIMEGQYFEDGSLRNFLVKLKLI